MPTFCTLPDDLLDRASSPLSASPRPYLRWAGSKQRILGQLAPFLPSTFGTYFEPFLGAGSLFFLLSPKRAVLSDACEELVENYRAVRDGASQVCRHLKSMRLCEDVYYEIRDARSRGRFKGAAEFIYLNKGCWNGLYRVNSSGQFNVPYGRPKTDFLIDIENVRACANALARRSVKLLHCDFEISLKSAKRGDFVYLDPPYVTRHNRNGFRDYNESLFSWDDQVRLAQVAESLVRRGVYVLISNASHDDVLDLYPSFEASVLTRNSTLAGDRKYRTQVEELVLRPTLARRSDFREYLIRLSKRGASAAQR